MKKIVTFEKLSRDKKTNWKRIGIELKLQEIIENMPETDFRYFNTSQELKAIVEKLEPFIEELEIEKLQPKLEEHFHPINPTVKMVNVPSQLCHHGSLKILGKLTNIKRLWINFFPSELGRPYERRFFKISVKDTVNIGKALMKLTKLENFKISSTNMCDRDKIRFIIEPLIESLTLKILDFSFCEIGCGYVESGEVFKTFLSFNISLEHLQLRGNRFDLNFCESFAEGLKEFKGKLKFLGLSLNSILGNGLHLILQSIQVANNVASLDISQCDNFHTENKNQCFDELIKLIKMRGHTTKIDFHSNQIECEEIKIKNIVLALDSNFKIEEFNFEDCGFSIDQLVKIKILLNRNQFYHDNPILKKDFFTEEDEVKIEKWLRRTKNSLLLKLRAKLSPQSKYLTPYHY